MERKRTIGYELRAINHLIGGKCCKNEKKDEERLPRMQGWTIGFLYDRQDRELFQKDVEAEFSISRATATNMLQALEQKGMITRIPVERDKRLKKIVLTAKAKEKHQQVMKSFDELEASYVKDFSEEEEEELIRLLKKLHQNLDEWNS